MFPVFQVGPLSVQSSGLILLAGLWLALTIVERYAAQLQSDPEEISNLTFYALIGGILGARLGYALQFPSAFADHPASLISLNPGLLDPLSGLLTAALVAFVYGQRKEMDVLRTLDALTPGAALMAIAISLSQLASGEAFGLPSSAPWAINLWGVERHPTQIYAILAGLLILYLLTSRMIPIAKAKGQVFLSYVSLTAFSRVFIDAFRGDDIPLLAGLRSSQIIAWLVLASALYFSIRLLSGAGKKA